MTVDKAQELANEVKWASESLVEKVVAFEDAARRKNVAQMEFHKALDALRKHASAENEAAATEGEKR